MVIVIYILYNIFESLKIYHIIYLGENMSVFAKTPKGLDSLRDMNSGMPRRMRTLLWCINGQTSTGTLIRSLTSLGDVKGLMRTLIAEGLIERIYITESNNQAVSQLSTQATDLKGNGLGSSGQAMGLPSQGQASTH